MIRELNIQGVKAPPTVSYGTIQDLKGKKQSEKSSWLYHSAIIVTALAAGAGVYAALTNFNVCPAPSSNTSSETPTTGGNNGSSRIDVNITKIEPLVGQEPLTPVFTQVIGNYTRDSSFNASMPDRNFTVVPLNPTDAISELVNSSRLENNNDTKAIVINSFNNTLNQSAFIENPAERKPDQVNKPLADDKDSETPAINLNQPEQVSAPKSGEQPSSPAHDFKFGGLFMGYGERGA